MRPLKLLCRYILESIMTKISGDEKINLLDGTGYGLCNISGNKLLDILFNTVIICRLCFPSCSINSYFPKCTALFELMVYVYFYVLKQKRLFFLSDVVNGANSIPESIILASFGSALNFWVKKSFSDSVIVIIFRKFEMSQHFQYQYLEYLSLLSLIEI